MGLVDTTDMDVERRAIAQPISILKAKRLYVTRLLDRYRAQANLHEQGYDPQQLREIERVLNLTTACRTGQLGSHLYRCSDCQRSSLGLNKCDNRHCPCCGLARRVEWRTTMIAWSLDCNYFHIVFTLPHDLNPLLKANPKELYKLLLRSSTQLLARLARDEFDCQPGITVTLHTWGQRMNLHVHCHIIMTAGGLSIDGSRWVTIPSEHPSLQPGLLARGFKAMFLRRLAFRMRRNQLIWPTVDQIDRIQGKLTSNEQTLLDKIKAKAWIVDCQATPAKVRGADAIINYLAAYVSGTAIGDRRLISDENGQVTFRFKDYKAGEVKTQTLTGAEFVQRFVMHILPAGIQRLRWNAHLFLVHVI